VTLFFAETYVRKAGGRVFDIYLEGNLVFENTDIWQLAGGKFQALTLTANSLEVLDGTLSIEMIADRQKPKINAIAIIFAGGNCPNPFPAAPVPAPVPAPVTGPVPAPVAAPVPAPVTGPPPGDSEPILINVGGDSLVDFLGRTWLADTYFTGGRTYSDGSSDIIGSQDDQIYQTERYGSFSYEIPMPSGDYEIILHFAEIYFQAAGRRSFDIFIEGNKMFSNVDIVQLAGQPLKALTLETPTLVTDGAVSILFTESVPAVNAPILSGIEINLLQYHLAHAVTNGPYSAVDSDDNGMESVSVDGFLSHT